MHDQLVLDSGINDLYLHLAGVFLFIAVCIHYAVTRYNRNLPPDSYKKKPEISSNSTSVDRYND